MKVREGAAGGGFRYALSTNYDFLLAVKEVGVRASTCRKKLTPR
jgi:hypothetical protein